MKRRLSEVREDFTITENAPTRVALTVGADLTFHTDWIQYFNLFISETRK